MASFQERLEKSRETREEAFRGVINAASQLRPSTQAEAAERRIIAEEQFRELGLHPFLIGARDFIRKDGHRDVTLDFDTHNTRYDWSETVQRTNMTLSEQALEVMEYASRSYSATFRFDTIDGEAGVGYSSFSVVLHPILASAHVVGANEVFLTAIPGTLDPIEEAIVEAYGKPAFIPALHHHPENQPPAVSQ